MAGRHPSSRSAAPTRPEFVQAVGRAVDHYNAGRWRAAEADARLALAFAPADPSALNVLGGVAMQEGRTAEAIALFQHALAGQPRNPFIQFNLGETHRLAHALAKALPYFERAAALKPDFAEAFAFAAEALRGLGRGAAAEPRYQTALRLAPKLPVALNGYGLLLLRRGEPSRAAPLFAAALDGMPPNHPMAPGLWSNLGVARLQLGQGLEGLDDLARAVDLSPQTPGLWRLLASSLRHTKVAPSGEMFRSILLQLFDRDDVNPRNLATAALAVLRQDAEIDNLLRAIEAQPADTTRIVAEGGAGAACLVQDPLFLALLEAAPIPSIAVEVLMVRLRADLLAAAVEEPEAFEGELALAARLARQSFLNEYAYFVGADEHRDVERLGKALDRNDLGRRPGDAVRIAILAAYRPLGATPLGARLLRNPVPGITDLVREQIAEPALERELRGGLPALKAATDPISVAVQRQYEESPYPRWTRCGVGAPLPFADAVRVALPHLGEKQALEVERPRVLIAGCGTGLETMRVANTYKDASILAVDLSGASLAYAMRKTQEYGLADVEHLQGDILDLPVLTERFDLIDSFGVLHHMADPAAGLQVLSDLLKAGGLLFMGLYSELGRQGVVEARAHIAARGYPATPDGIRALRHDLMTGPRPPQLEMVLSPASDFWTTSDCRDLVFHVNEHRFTLPEVGQMLADAGLEFLGLQFGHAADRTRFLAEHPDAGAIQDVTALHRHESDHPEVFGDTYRIWARRPRHRRRR
jgi:Tfp pilus assembly protein PilF/SAM-dependent methyltransferase